MNVILNPEHLKILKNRGTADGMNSVLRIQPFASNGNRF